jgi:integrase/recombinase XerD
MVRNYILLCVALLPCATAKDFRQFSYKKLLILKRKLLAEREGLAATLLESITYASGYHLGYHIQHIIRGRQCARVLALRGIPVINKVTVHVRIKTAEGKRIYCRPVYGANKKLRAGWALVNGQPEAHPEAVFVLRYTDRGRRKWEHVGEDPAKAHTAKLRREHILTGRAIGKPVVYDPQPDDGASWPDRKPLAVAIDDYVTGLETRRKPKTASAYGKALELFSESCRKQYLDEITREDLLTYSASLVARGNSARTTANRLGYVFTFLRHHDIQGLLKTSDKPRYTKRAPNSYSREFLKRLFSACNAEERLLFRFFLLTGCREQEVSYACWSDLDLSRRMLTIQEKADLDWTLKDYEERSIPLVNSDRVDKV